MALDGDEYVIHIRPDVNPAEFRAATDLALDSVEHEFAESGAEAGRRFAAAMRRNAAIGMRGLGAMVGGGAGLAAGGAASLASGYRAHFGIHQGLHSMGEGVPVGATPVVAGGGRDGRIPGAGPGGRYGQPSAAVFGRYGPGWQFIAGSGSAAGPASPYLRGAGISGLFGGPVGIAGVALGATAFGGAMAYNYAADADAAERRAFQMYGTEIDQLSTQTEKWTRLLGAAKHELYGISEGLLQVLVPLEQNRSEAERLSLEFSDIASKLALFKNADPIQVGRAIQRGLVGEFETLKTYHIPITRNQITDERGRPLPFGPEYTREFMAQLQQYAQPASLYQPPRTQATVRGLGASAKAFAVSLGRAVEPAFTPLFEGLTSILESWTGDRPDVPTSGIDFRAADRMLMNTFMTMGDIAPGLRNVNRVGPVRGRADPSGRPYYSVPRYYDTSTGLNRETAEQILYQLTSAQQLGRNISSRAQGTAYTDALEQLGIDTSVAANLDPESLTPAITRWRVAVEDLTRVEEARLKQEEQDRRDRAELDYQDKKHRLTLPERNLIAYNQWRESFFDDQRQRHQWTSFVEGARVRATLQQGQTVWNRTQQAMQAASLSQAQVLAMQGFQDRLNELSIGAARQRQIANNAVGTAGSHFSYNQIFRSLKELGAGAATTFGDEEDVARGQLVQQAFALINALPDSMRGAYLADLPRDLKAYGVNISSDLQKYISTAQGAIGKEAQLTQQISAVEQGMKNALAWFEDRYPESEKKLMRLAGRPAAISPQIDAAIAEFGFEDFLGQALQALIDALMHQAMTNFFKELPPGIADAIGGFDFSAIGGH